MNCPTCGNGDVNAGQACPQCGNYVPKAKSRDDSDADEIGSAARADAPTSALAIASLICGISAAVLCLAGFGIPLAIAGIITGHIAKSRIRSSGGYLGGSGLATGGLVLSYLIPVAVLLALLGIGGVTFFGDDIRRAAGGSADALAGDDIPGARR